MLIKVKKMNNNDYKTHKITPIYPKIKEIYACEKD